MAEKSISPYLKDPQRLSDVIAAIQVLGTYKYYKRNLNNWAEAISGDDEKKNGKYWREIFLEHPEFFRIPSKEDKKSSLEEKASLVWRRTYQRRYSVDTEKTLTKEECENLIAKGKKNRISRMPLKNEDIKMLVDTAINLHSLAFEEKKDKRWWINILMAFVGAILGAAIGSSEIMKTILN